VTRVDEAVASGVSEEFEAATGVEFVDELPTVDDVSSASDAESASLVVCAEVEFTSESSAGTELTFDPTVFESFSAVILLPGWFVDSVSAAPFTLLASTSAEFSSGSLVVCDAEDSLLVDEVPSAGAPGVEVDEFDTFVLDGVESDVVPVADEFTSEVSGAGGAEFVVGVEPAALFDVSVVEFSLFVAGPLAEEFVGAEASPEFEKVELLEFAAPSAAGASDVSVVVTFDAGELGAGVLDAVDVGVTEFAADVVSKVDDWLLLTTGFVPGTVVCILLEVESVAVEESAGFVFDPEFDAVVFDAVGAVLVDVEGEVIVGAVDALVVDDSG